MVAKRQGPLPSQLTFLHLISANGAIRLLQRWIQGPWGPNPPDPQKIYARHNGTCKVQNSPI